MIIPGKYLLFLGDVADRLDAKTACGLLDWAPERCAGQWRLPSCGVDLGLEDMGFDQARAAGAQTLVIGVTPFGGAIADTWIAPITAALDAGLNVASGMHRRLGSVPEIAAAAERSGASLFDVRVPGRSFPVGTGRKRTGRRMLMVGTDCAVGKKYTALAIARAMAESGRKATFRATGQTGILIAGEGVPIDAIVSDFIAGAAESLSPDNDADHWDVIEGQGSLFHPAYAGVALGLLHGSQPDAIILCHAAGRTHVDGYPDFLLPELAECIEANLDLARRTNPAVRCAGISVNTSALPAEARAGHLQAIADRFGLPCFDPVATGADALVAHVAATFD
ncbi:MAG: N-acetyltransferase DgcN [Sphingobium sp.]